MEKILISACLVGEKCRYDGHTNYAPLYKELLEKYELVPFCCEVEGGLPTPRVPNERKGDRVIDEKGKDNTKKFMLGVEKAINICKYLDIKIAILKDGSPSCGVYEIHDGNFKGRKIEGQGVLTEALRNLGIKVYSEKEIELLLK